MSPSANGSCSGPSLSRNARAAPGSVRPRRTQHLGRDPLDAELGGELAHALGRAGRDRERRGHPANLGIGPDAAPRRRLI